MHRHIASQLVVVDRLARTVGRAVVRDDDFLLDAGQRDRRNAIEHFLDRLFLVIDGDDDR